MRQGRFNRLLFFSLTGLGAVMAVAGPMRAQVLDGSKTPHVFSDREALGILFTVARSQPSSGWDYATRQKYLMDIGLSRPQANRLIEAADAWFQQIYPLDEELRAILKSATGKSLDQNLRRRCDELAAAKFAFLDSHLANLRLQFGAEGAARLDRALLTVKRGMKAYAKGSPPEMIQKGVGRHHE